MLPTSPSLRGRSDLVGITTFPWLEREFTASEQAELTAVAGVPLKEITKQLITTESLDPDVLAELGLRTLLSARTGHPT